MTTRPLAPSPVGVRVELAALWAATLFLFVYVDLFSLYRPDVRADLAAGEIGGVRVDGTLLVGATLYVAVPSVMIALTVLGAPRLVRALNLIVAALFGLSIVASAVGEWGYFVLGSAIELVLLATLGWRAWRWPAAVTVPAPPTPTPSGQPLIPS